MDPSEKLTAVRKAIGASVRQMADLVGLSGPNANDRILEMEAGSRPVSGPIERVLDYIAQSADIGTSDLGNLILARQLPDFVELRSMGESEPHPVGVMHTKSPRFIAVFSEALPAPMRDRLADSGLESVPGVPGLGDLVAIPVDRYPGSVKVLLERAAKLYSESSRMQAP